MSLRLLSPMIAQGPELESWSLDTFAQTTSNSSFPVCFSPLSYNVPPLEASFHISRKPLVDKNINIDKGEAFSPVI